MYAKNGFKCIGYYVNNPRINPVYWDKYKLWIYRHFLLVKNNGKKICYKNGLILFLLYKSHLTLNGGGS